MCKIVKERKGIEMSKRGHNILLNECLLDSLEKIAIHMEKELEPLRNQKGVRNHLKQFLLGLVCFGSFWLGISVPLVLVGSYFG